MRSFAFQVPRDFVHRQIDLVGGAGLVRRGKISNPNEYAFEEAPGSSRTRQISIRACLKGVNLVRPFFEVTLRPLIFISAVSRELHSARQLVANTLTFLGYQPIWQDIFGTEGGDLRGLLRQQIDQCKGVVQLVGQCYGAEPPTADEQFGRVSYTQYEALYGRKRGKKIWYLFIDEHFPRDACDDEPAELRELQATYRLRLQSDTDVFHPLTSSEALEASVLKLRGDLIRLRRGVKLWAVGVTTLLILIVALVIWQLRSEAETNAQLAKLRQGILEYPQMEAQVRGSRTEDNPAVVQERIYAELGKQLGVDPKILREKLLQFADELRHAPNTSPSERANAAFVAGNYPEAERLIRSVIEERARALGPEHPDTLDSRQRLIYALTRQTKYAEAEAEAREVLKLRQKVLGPEHLDTVVSRYNLADTLVEQGKNAEAEALYREVIRLDEKLLGPEHPRTLAARLELATVLESEGKNVEAESLYREVIKLDEKVYGFEHPNTLNDRMNLATALQADGKYQAAEAEYRDVIKLEAKIIGTEKPDILISRSNLAELLDDEGKFAEAEAECRQIISLEQKMLGPENLVTLNSRANLAVALIGEGKFADAATEYKDVLNLMERVLGVDHPDTLGYTTKFATGLQHQNKIVEAREIAEGAAGRARKVLGPDNPSTQKYAKLVQDLEASR